MSVLLSLLRGGTLPVIYRDNDRSDKRHFEMMTIRRRTVTGPPTDVDVVLDARMNALDVIVRAKSVLIRIFPRCRSRKARVIVQFFAMIGGVGYVLGISLSGSALVFYVTRRGPRSVLGVTEARFIIPWR